MNRMSGSADFTVREVPSSPKIKAEKVEIDLSFDVCGTPFNDYCTQLSYFGLVVDF